MTEKTTKILKELVENQLNELQPVYYHLEHQLKLPIKLRILEGGEDAESEHRKNMLTLKLQIEDLKAVQSELNLYY